MWVPWECFGEGGLSFSTLVLLTKLHPPTGHVHVFRGVIHVFVLVAFPFPQRLIHRKEIGHKLIPFLVHHSPEGEKGFRLWGDRL